MDREHTTFLGFSLFAEGKVVKTHGNHGNKSIPWVYGAKSDLYGSTSSPQIHKVYSP